MESVQRFILSSVLLLFFVTMGADRMSVQAEPYVFTSSLSYFQQPETPFEAAMHLLAMNRVADIPCSVSSPSVSDAFSHESPVGFGSVADESFHNTNLTRLAVEKAPRQQRFQPGGGYTIYMLRHILI